MRQRRGELARQLLRFFDAAVVGQVAAQQQHVGGVGDQAQPRHACLPAAHVVKVADGRQAHPSLLSCSAAQQAMYRRGRSAACRGMWLARPEATWRTPCSTRPPARRRCPAEGSTSACCARSLRHDVPCLIGGTYALEVYTGIRRATKDLDLFILRDDWSARRDAACAADGIATELTFPHWLGKAGRGTALRRSPLRQRQRPLRRRRELVRPRAADAHLARAGTALSARGDDLVQVLRAGARAIRRRRRPSPDCTRRPRRSTGRACWSASGRTGKCCSVTSCCSASSFPASATACRRT